MTKEKLEKEVSIKRIQAWIVFDNLRSIPPRDFETVGDIKVLMNSVLPAFKKHIQENLDMMMAFRSFNEKAQEDKLPQADIEKKASETNEVWRKYNKEHAKEVVVIELDKEGHAILVSLFKKFGSKMFNTIEEFVEVETAINGE